jgi:hypothetical protein
VLELILSDITVMGQGYCVIGLEGPSPGVFRSIRPMPPWGFAWREPFPFRRGDCVRMESRPTTAARPHVEDVQSCGLIGTGRSLPQEDLVRCLKKAEVSQDLEHLFGCQVECGSSGGRAVWVNPADACRSICGCEYENLRFRLYPESQGFTLRAEIILKSGERINSIPVVDRDWRKFVAELVQRIHRSNPLPLAERFLNRSFGNKLLARPELFARVGLPRPRDDQRCWLMLDSLFPQPESSWLSLL